jgi:hypothetical protein
MLIGISQHTPTVRTGFRPMPQGLNHFLRRRQLPMVALTSRLATGMAYAFSPVVFSEHEAGLEMEAERNYRNGG